MPKSANTGCSIGGQEHIFRLQVAVNDIQAMGAGQGIGQIQSNFKYLLDRQASLVLEQITERSSGYILQ